MTVTGWLVVLAVVAGVNPARVVRAGRGAGTSDVGAGTAMAGTALGGSVLVLLAVGGAWIVEGLDVSAPTAWVGAGLVLVLAGAWATVGPLPLWEPALPGRRGALVPVAVPLVARPEAGLVAVAAGADGHRPAVLLGIGLCVILVGAGLGRAPGPAGPSASPAAVAADGVGAAGAAMRVAGWAARGAGALAVAAGIALAVAGVYAI